MSEELGDFLGLGMGSLSALVCGCIITVMGTELIKAPVSLP